MKIIRCIIIALDLCSEGGAVLKFGRVGVKDMDERKEKVTLLYFQG
jgi:hypothetical protein